MEKDFFEIFLEMVEDDVRYYKDEFWEIIKLAPPMFKLFVNLLRDPDVPAKSKPIINATIAYFVAPLDVIPEELYGSVGYLDDLMLCAWSLKRLEDEVGYGVLRKNWDGDRELGTVVDEVYETSREKLWEVEKDILEYVGLSG